MLRISRIVTAAPSLLILLSFLISDARAQYWGEQVLEKSFERADFFFTPADLNPFALGAFGSAAVGLFDDPLLNLQITPAYLAADTLSRHLGYVDFRNSRQITGTTYHPYYTDYHFSRSSRAISYGSYFAESRVELEPVVSAAYLRRVPGLPQLTLGATYQLIYQDERYYTVPQDIYRSNPEAAFADRATAEETIPIIDRFSGSDAMRQRGHFATLVASYRILPALDVGVRVGRTLFDRNGSFGSHNLWPSDLRRESLRDHRVERGQDYDHWDVGAGLNLRVSPDVIVGVSGGYLAGDAGQTLVQRDTSFSHYRPPNGDRESLYIHAGFQDQSWDHDGRTFYGGLNLRARVSRRAEVNAYYRRTFQDIDIGLGSALTDTSYSMSHSTYNDWIYESESHSSVSDSRTGLGVEEQRSHTSAVYLHWTIDRNTSVYLGGSLMQTHRSVHTEEDVLSSRHSYYFWKRTQNSVVDEETNTRATDEDKQLRWDFDADYFSANVPVFFTRRLSDTFTLLFGVNRRIRGWEIEDVTLAIFDYRRQFEDGATQLDENFGERYTLPRERLTDVQTTIMTGLTITPAQEFEVRFLVVPDFAQSSIGATLREFQWWISFAAMPQSLER